MDDVIVVRICGHASGVLNIFRYQQPNPDTAGKMGQGRIRFSLYH